MLDPLVLNGTRLIDFEKWRASQPVYQARYEQMVQFVHSRLAGIFDAIDDGAQGKPIADLFIDDRGLRFQPARTKFATDWSAVAQSFGSPE